MAEIVLYVRESRTGRYVAAPADRVVSAALATLSANLRAAGAAMSSPENVKQFLQLRIGSLPHEMFGVVFLDAQHRLIHFEEMFRGTLTSCSVYPREVVSRALQLSASAVILTHNHPSNEVTPSRADEHLTQTLKAALALIDVKVLDHIIVGVDRSYSMAEAGLI